MPTPAYPLSANCSLYTVGEYLPRSFFLPPLKIFSTHILKFSPPFIPLPPLYALTLFSAHFSLDGHPRSLPLKHRQQTISTSSTLYMENDGAAEDGGISYQNMWQSLKRGQSHLHAPILITYYNNKYNFIMQKKKQYTPVLYGYIWCGHCLTL